jgi:S1-C subfamily serine protease
MKKLFKWYIASQVIAGAALAVWLIMSGQVAMGHDYGGEGLRRADASTLDVGLVSAAGDFQARAAAVMTRYGVLTADHVCENMANAKRPAVQFVGGYRVRPFGYIRSPDQSKVDLCVIKIPYFVGVKTRWLSAVIAQRDLEFGARAYHIGNYLEPRWMAEGPVGRRVVSKMRTSTATLRAMYTLAGPGSSGGGVWNRNGELVGITSQARVFRAGYGSVMGQGAVFYVPTDIIRHFLGEPVQ